MPRGVSRVTTNEGTDAMGASTRQSQGALVAAVLLLSCSREDDAGGSRAKQDGESRSVKLVGTSKDTLFNGQYTARIEKVEEDMDVSPFSATVGQTTRSYHVVVGNPGSSAIDFSTFVGVVLGAEAGEEYVHTMDAEGGLSIPAGGSIRARVHTPPWLVPSVRRVSVGLKRGDRVMGEPMIFDVTDAVAELGPTLQRIRGTSAAGK